MKLFKFIFDTCLILCFNNHVRRKNENGKKMNPKELEIYKAQIDKAILNLDQDTVVSSSQHLINTNELTKKTIIEILENKLKTHSNIDEQTVIHMSEKILIQNKLKY